MSDFTIFDKNLAENVLIGAFFQYNLYKNKFIKSSSFVSSEDNSSLRRKITFYIKTSLSKKLKDTDIERYISWLKIDRSSIVICFNSSCSFNRYFDAIGNYCSFLLRKMNEEYFSSEFIEFSFERNNCLRVGLNERFIRDKRPVKKDENGCLIKDEKILFDKVSIVFEEISVISDILIDLFKKLHYVDTNLYRNTNHHWSAEELNTLILSIREINRRYQNPQHQWTMEPLLRIFEATTQLVKLKEDHGIDISNIKYEHPKDSCFYETLYDCWVGRLRESPEYIDLLTNCSTWAVDSLNQVRAELGIND